MEGFSLLQRRTIMKRYALLVLVAGLLVAADDKDNAIKQETKRLEGTWQVVGGEENGQESAPDAIKNLKLTFVFTGNKVAVKVDGVAQGEDTTFRLDPSKKPRELDMLVKDRVVKRCIYSLDGDELKLCFPVKEETARPSGFRTQKEDGRVLYMLKRVEPK